MPFSDEIFDQILNEIKENSKKDRLKAKVRKVTKKEYINNNKDNLIELQVIDQYFIGGVSIEDKMSLLQLAKQKNISISVLVAMCLDFANEIDDMQEFFRIQYELKRFIENGGKFGQEYWDERNSNPYDWLRCITPRRALENDYSLSTMTYHGFDNVEKYKNINNIKTRLDKICYEIATFADNNIDKNYLCGMWIFHCIIENIQLTQNASFNAIGLTTEDFHGNKIFEIFDDSIVEKLKSLMDE